MGVCWSVCVSGCVLVSVSVFVFLGLEGGERGGWDESGFGMKVVLG